MAVDPTMLLQLAGALKGAGGGGTKVSQTATNTSQSIVSFTSNNNLGGGRLDGGAGSPVSTPITNSASASAGGGGYGSLPSYDYGVSGGGDVAASVAPTEGDFPWVWVGLAAAAATFGWIMWSK